MCNKHYQQIAKYGAIVRSNRDPNEIEICENYALVHLYKNKEVVAKAIIDLEDVELVGQYKWFINDKYNHVRNSNMTGFLQHCVMKSSEMYDHINTNALDNRKENLRLCTGVENGRNVSKYSNNSSGAKGVSWDKRLKQYCAHVSLNGNKCHIGVFSNLIDAATAYNIAATEYYKEFANLNDIEKLKERIANGDFAIYESILNEQNVKLAKQKANQSGIKGISWAKNMRKWHVYFDVPGKRVKVGYFSEKEDAVKAQIEAIRMYNDANNVH